MFIYIYFLYRCIIYVLYIMYRKIRVRADISEEIVSTKKCGHLTPCLFYSSLYMDRAGIFNYTTKGHKFFQKFVVANYVKEEIERLNFR